ncbi:MAG: HAD-IB family hydrolase [Actinomycetes bacterium]|jgi:HAD superfamily hydrolase (TIGR01490 family)
MALPLKRVAFFDVDNTLMRGSSLFFLSKGMYQRGFFTKKDISNFVMANLRYRLSGIENREEIDKIQGAACEFFRGHDVASIEKMGIEVYDEYVSPALWQGTIEIANNHLDHDEEVWLVTATPKDLADLIANRLGFTGALGTVAEVKEGVYTGKLIGQLLHGPTKAIAIKALAAEHGIDLANSYAYSDSHHDIPLLEAVGNPRAINPDTLLQIHALREGWPIYDFRRMRALKKVAAPLLGPLVKLRTLVSPRSWRRSK